MIPVVASVALAKRMERCGADAVVAEGTEAGGHIGENTTMVLVPKLRMQFRFRLLQLVGLQMEEVLQRYSCWERREFSWEPALLQQKKHRYENYKNCILKARDIDSRVTGRSTGHPVRALRNQMTKTYLQKEQEGAAFEELELLTLGGLKKWLLMGMFKMEVSWQVRSQG